MRISCVAIVSAALAACGTAAPPPPDRAFDGLPVTGSRAFAERLGFKRCFDTSNALRCQKDAVRLFGTGPYHAAVDLAGGGASGFRQVTLWHEQDQDAVYAVSDALQAKGWRLCRVGTEDRGDEEIWTLPGSPVRVSMDLSYWGKRRVRVLPEQGQPTGRCW